MKLSSPRKPRDAAGIEGATPLFISLAARKKLGSLHKLLPLLESGHVQQHRRAAAIATDGTESGLHGSDCRPLQITGYDDDGKPQGLQARHRHQRGLATLKHID